MQKSRPHTRVRRPCGERTRTPRRRYVWRCGGACAFEISAERTGKRDRVSASLGRTGSSVKVFVDLKDAGIDSPVLCECGGDLVQTGMYWASGVAVFECRKCGKETVIELSTRQ